MNIHISKFNDRVKAMNQMRSRDLTMSADDARNLQAEIFALLAQISRLEELTKQSPEERIEIKVDGGKFS